VARLWREDAVAPVTEADVTAGKAGPPGGEESLERRAG
jgi:hypothetical protein